MLRKLIPTIDWWTKADHYEILRDGWVMFHVPLGWGIHAHRYRDTGFNEREIVVWLNWIAFRLGWYSA